MDIKNICIIIPYEYPVPAIKGGAIETLITFLIDENEIEHRFNFTVLSTWDRDLRDSQYRYTKFVYYKKNRVIDGPWKFICRAIKKLFRVYIPYTPRIVSIIKYLKGKDKEYDYVLFENGWSYNLPLIAKVFPKERILNHLHWGGDGNKYIDNSFEYLLPVSTYIGEQWKKSTGRDDNSIVVWKNCFDERSFCIQREKADYNELKSKIGIACDNKLIVFVGRTIPEKGIDILIHAMDKIQSENVSLLIIGKANFGNKKMTVFERQLKSQIAKSKSSIIQLGFVPNNELYRYYQIADLCVLPSVFEDPAPMAIIEALSTGVPLITTRRGGIPEYVGDGAYLIDVTDNMVNDLANAIDLLLSNKPVSYRLAVRGREQAKLYTRKKYYSRMVDIIEMIDSAKEID